MSSIKSALAGSHLSRRRSTQHTTHQQFEDIMKCGSRRAFVTDMYINGEYLRSRTDNQYFCVVDKTAEVGYVSGYTAISVIWTKPRGSEIQPRKTRYTAARVREK
jgi:hypothetical protein